MDDIRGRDAFVGILVLLVIVSVVGLFWMEILEWFDTTWLGHVVYPSQDGQVVG